MVTPDATIGLLWLPALGVASRHYERFGVELRARRVRLEAVEWRGTGTSSLRAGRRQDWGYRELLTDARRALDAAQAAQPGVAWVVGGHSMGGQLAALLAATICSEGSTSSAKPRGLVLIASGVPHWKLFRGTMRAGVRVFAEALPALTAVVGHFPGTTLGFAGREASGVMLDWRRSVLTGDYSVRGVELNLEVALSRLQVPVIGITLQEDRLAPEASMQALLSKLPRCTAEKQQIDSTRLGTAADHFAWLKKPNAIAEEIARWSSDNLDTLPREDRH